MGGKKPLSEDEGYEEKVPPRVICERAMQTN
jgi:hypothetical protein